MSLSRYTTSYVGYQVNFSIQNLPDIKDCLSREESLAFDLVFNILHRGIPTKPSPQLSEALHEECKFACQEYPKRQIHPNLRLSLPESGLINKPPEWTVTIKGDNSSGNYPALRFIRDSISKALPKFAFVSHLLRPECPFDEMISIEGNSGKIKGASSQVADFYLADADLVIEIDGSQHQQEEWSDKRRDAFLKRFGINVLRIPSHEVDLVGSNVEPSWIGKLNEILEASPSLSALANDLLDECEKKDDERLLLPVSVIRLEILLLELLSRGSLSIKDQSWEVQIKSNASFSRKAMELAYADVIRWLRPIFELQKYEFKSPSLIVNVIDADDDWLKSSSIKIDECSRSRWTDGAIEKQEVIFVRNDYFDFKRRECSIDGVVRTRLHDHFAMRVSDSNPYSLGYIPEVSEISALEEILYLLFGYEKLNPGQPEIISAALRRVRCIGLLPTGGGKSITFQLPVFLQPGPSVVVAPIKSLMDDQVMDMQKLGMNRAARITSDTPASEREYIQNAFVNGRVFLLYISPERFQMPLFRESIAITHHNRKIMYAVIDESHCVSEWGHDFRTSYLALASTIERHLPGTSVIAVTATASENVLKDIQRMFGVDDIEVHSRMDLGRPELNFKVEEVEGSLSGLLLSQLTDRINIFTGQNPTGSGLIFFPHVNGAKGCYPMSGVLSQHFECEVGCYAGSKPKLWAGARQAWDSYKKITQQNFKKDKIRLICATKAFGMGINKKDVRFTIHYGLPSSIESLYQEGGRAGRDGKMAEAIVLFKKEKNSEVIEKLSSASIRSPDGLVGNFQEIKNNKNEEGDFLSQYWFISGGVHSLRSQFFQIRILRDYIQEKGGFVDPDEVYADLELMDKGETCHKSIYRLYQLGYIDDWTVNYGADHKSTMEVIFRKVSTIDLKNNLLSTIRRYDGVDAEREVEKFICNAIELLGSISEEDSYLAAIILWTHDKFVYNRVQSLTNLYSACDNFDAEHPELFRLHLESFFKRNGTTALIQEVTALGDSGVDRAIALLCRTDNDLGFILDKETLLTIHAPLSRFLESYRSSVGLNISIGLCNLLLRRYNDPNGYSRFESAILQLRRGNSDLKVAAQSILRAGKSLSGEQKFVLGKWVMQAFGDDLNAIEVFEGLGDAASLQKLVQDQLNPSIEYLNRSLMEWK